MARVAREASFFCTWSAERAYILGYWWADGCMYIKPSTTAHEIRIASNDLDHLQAIAAIVGLNVDLRRVAQNSNTYVISWYSKMMYQDIRWLGGTPRKSRTIGFPPVPAEWLAHFVRGVVDGDGTLVWNGDRPVIQVYSGSTAFLAALGEAIAQETGIPAPNLVANRDNWYIKWSTVRAKCLAAWLYIEHPGLELARKAAIAAYFLEWQPKKRPNAGTITEEMLARFRKYLPPVGA
jgi:hypothetical protein